jgi:hypothetical protein
MGGARVEMKMFALIFSENHFHVFSKIVCETIPKSQKLSRNPGENFGEN